MDEGKYQYQSILLSMMFVVLCIFNPISPIHCPFICMLSKMMLLDHEMKTLLVNDVLIVTSPIPMIAEQLLLVNHMILVRV